MRASRWRWAVGLALGTVAAGTARADAVRPWSGASASAGSTTNTGAMATASDQWDRPAGTYASGSEPTAQASGSSSARAGGPVGSLLTVDTRATLGSSNSAEPVSGGTSTASARWADDVIRITPPPGASLPDQIQVRLALTFDTPTLASAPGSPLGAITAQANGTKVTISDPTIQGREATFRQFDYVVWNDTKSVGRFYTNLNIGAGGESDPISLELAAESTANSLGKDGASGSNHAVLGIDAVTFLDGTPLADRGYTVTYASAELVPEPASVLAWTGLSMGGAWLVRRRRARRAA